MCGCCLPRGAPTGSPRNCTGSDPGMTESAIARGRCRLMLEMKSACQQCQARLGYEDAAWICSYECTYCPDCRTDLQRCPNCNGQLTPRPRRHTS